MSEASPDESITSAVEQEGGEGGEKISPLYAVHAMVEYQDITTQSRRHQKDQKGFSCPLFIISYHIASYTRIAYHISA